MFTGSEVPRLGNPAVKILLLAGALILCAIGVLIFFVYDPAKVPMFPGCMFHQLTGLDCPGCGAQRALHQLLHGNIVAALRLNAMFVVSLPLCAWFIPRYAARILRNEPVTFNARWLWIYFAAWMAFGLLRNLPFPFFAWFAAP